MEITAINGWYIIKPVSNGRRKINFDTITSEGSSTKLDTLLTSSKILFIRCDEEELIWNK